MEISKENFLKLPEVPGVYTFWKKNTPIYIGKSVNLKSRLNSYLAITLGVKTAQMVSEADSVTYIEVLSELESLLLESHLVRKHKPKYNIVLKDDKHALYIIITKEEFPRVLAVRKLTTSELKVEASYGPFPSSMNVKMILKLLRRVFPYSDHKIGKKPCLYSHLGLCVPCPNVINQSINKEELKKTYKKNIRHVKLVLSRKFNTVRNSIEKEMNKMSKNQNYEGAKVMRDKLKALDYITQERIQTEQFLENPNLVEDVRQTEMTALMELFSKIDYPTSLYKDIKSLNRIECFDIAHLSGASTTASMVVLIDGEKENSEYRHFKVRQSKRQSDYDSMKEIAKRRVKNLVNWDRPDLIIVDGGLGQVKIFNDVFSEINIPVVGIAKHPDRLVFPNGIKIRLAGPVLRMVSRIRDEAHRFARRYHHKLISKALLTPTTK